MVQEEEEEEVLSDEAQVQEKEGQPAAAASHRDIHRASTEEAALSTGEGPGAEGEDLGQGRLHATRTLRLRRIDGRR